MRIFEYNMEYEITNKTSYGTRIVGSDYSRELSLIDRIGLYEVSDFKTVMKRHTWQCPYCGEHGMRITRHCTMMHIIDGRLMLIKAKEKIMFVLFRDIWNGIKNVVYRNRQ